MSKIHLVNCAICGSSVELLYEGIPGYQAPNRYDIFVCNTCDLQVAAPLAVDAAIYEKIYSNGASVPGYDRYFEYRNAVRKSNDPLKFLRDREDVYWGICRAIEQSDLEPLTARILEIGSGFGYLTYALHRRGYSIKGVDLSSEAVAQARSAFGDIFEHRSIEDLHQAGESFDAVIMAEIVEHVPDPAGLLRNVVGLLKRGGSIILTTPNRSYYEKEVIWETELPPVHLWWFTETSMRQIARLIDAEAAFVDYSDFNRQFYAGPPRGYLSPEMRSPVFSSSGEIAFREQWHLAALRSLHLYHRIRRFRDRLKARTISAVSSRRGTLCVRFTPR